MTQRVLITGAAGFIGSNLARVLVDNGDEVVGIDTFDPFYDRRLKEHNLTTLSSHPNFELLDVDIRDTATLIDRCRPTVDVIVHLAALAGVRPSAERPVEYMDVNVAGTASMLELARRCEVPQFVFASSSSVYGINPHVPWTEDAVPSPISIYASSKLAGERQVAHAAANGGFSAVATRLFTVYGPGQRPDLAITNFAARIMNNKPINVFGDGTALRDFTYVDDIVAGLRAAMAHEARPFDIFNLARGRRVELMDVIRTIERTLDTEAVINFTDPIRGDVPQTWGSIERAADILGYEPETDLTVGIESSQAWFKLVADTVDEFA